MKTVYHNEEVIVI